MPGGSRGGAGPAARWLLAHAEELDFFLEKGVIVGWSVGGRQYGNTVTLAPPLVLTRAEVDRIVEVLDQACPWLGAQLAGSA